jgi:hypothetical protein
VSTGLYKICLPSIEKLKKEPILDSRFVELITFLGETTGKIFMKAEYATRYLPFIHSKYHYASFDDYLDKAEDLKFIWQRRERIGAHLRHYICLSDPSFRSYQQYIQCYPEQQPLEEKALDENKQDIGQFYTLLTYMGTWGRCEFIKIRIILDKNFHSESGYSRIRLFLEAAEKRDLIYILIHNNEPFRECKICLTEKGYQTYLTIRKRQMQELMQESVQNENRDSLETKENKPIEVLVENKESQKVQAPQEVTKNADSTEANRDSVDDMILDEAAQRAFLEEPLLPLDFNEMEEGEVSTLNAKMSLMIEDKTTIKDLKEAEETKSCRKRVSTMDLSEEEPWKKQKESIDEIV